MNGSSTCLRNRSRVRSEGVFENYLMCNESKNAETVEWPTYVGMILQVRQYRGVLYLGITKVVDDMMFATG